MRPNFQVVKDVAASHNKIIRLFERINFLLQRLNIYTEIPLTNDFTELLGKIMAELLSILAISTKEMTDGKMSELIYSSSPLISRVLTGYGLRKVSEEADGKDGGRGCPRTIGYVHKRRNLDGGNKKLGCYASRRW